MTDDDKALVKLLREMQENWKAAYLNKASHMFGQAADRIEAQAAEIEKLQFLCDLNAVPAGIIEDRGRAEERAKIVAWLEKNAKLNPHLPEAMAVVLLFSQAITKEAHLK